MIILPLSKRTSNWLAHYMKCEEKVEVEWLPTSIFGTQSCFVMMFRNLCLDVKIDADVVRVAQTSESGQTKEVTFGSEIELEHFLRKNMRLKMKEEQNRWHQNISK